MGAGIQVKIHPYSNPTQVKQTLFGRRSPKCLSELKARGGGSFQIARSDAKIRKDPTLRDGRNVAKISVDGTTVGAFLVGDRNSTLVDVDGVPGYEIAGEGLKFWFDDAEVRPYGGLSALSQTERYFNFASEQGSWYVSGDWITPFDFGQLGSSSWPWGIPEKWPEQARSARWIWASSYSASMPTGPCYFRYSITLASAGRYAIYSAADDMFELYVDGQKLQASEPKDTAYRTASRVEVSLTAGAHIIAYRAQNNINFGGPAALAHAILQVNTDGTESVVGTSQTTNWKALPYPAAAPGWTPGEVLTTLLTEAQARGVLFPTWLTRTFTATTDSYGVAWPEKADFSFKVGESLLSVVDKLEESMVDIWIDPGNLNLNMAPVRGVDRSSIVGNGVWTERYRNYINSPSMENWSGLVELRRNLARYSNAENGTTTGWAGNLSAVVTNVTTQAYYGTRSYQVVTPGAAIGEGLNQDISATTGPQSSGVAATAETISAWVLAPFGAALQMTAEEYVPGGAFVASRGTTTFTGTGTWQQVSVTTSTKVTASNILRMVVRTTSIQAITYYVDCVQGEVGSTVQPYMDGSFRPRLRENFAQDPGAASATGGNGSLNSWSGPAGVTVANRNVTATWSKSGKALRTIWTTLPSNNQGVAQAQGLKPIIRVAGLWTFRWKAKITGGGSPSASGTGISLTEFGTGNTTISASGMNQTATDEWEIWATANITDWPAFQAQANPRVDKTINNPTLSTVMELSELDIYPGAYDPTRQWFWGSSNLGPGYAANWEGTLNASRSFVWDDDLSVSWVSTSNASASTYNALAVSGMATPSGGRIWYQSAQWKNTGSYSLKVLPYSTSDSFAQVSMPITIASAVGKTFTLAANFNLPQLQTGTPHGYARGYRIAVQTPAGQVELIPNNDPRRAANVLGKQTVVMTFTVPADATAWNFVRLMNGDGGQGAAHWDNLTLVEGDYPGLEPFDGSTVTADPLTVYQWAGTVNNSQSIVQRQGILRTAVEFRIGKHLRRATTRSRTKIKNSLSLKTEEGWLTDTSAASISKYGVLEGSLDTGSSAIIAKQLSKLVFAQRAQEEEGATYDFVVQDYIPFVHFDIGDWVLAPDDLGLMVKRRVMSIALDETTGGQPIYTIEFDTIFRENEERLNKIVEKLSGGGVGGGMSNVQGVTPGVGFPAPTPPDIPPIQLKPKTPTGLTSTTNTGFWSADGVRMYTQLVLDWADVVQNTDNSATVPQYYQVYGNLQGNPNIVDFGLVTASTMDIKSINPGEQWVFQVRALSSTGVYSDWSTTYAVTANAPSTPMVAPSTPTLATDNGLLIITWDGLLTGAVVPPKQFRYLYAEVGTSATGPWTRKGNVLTGAGQISVPNETLGAQRWVRLYAVDGAGILSTVSAVAGPITIVGVDTGDLSSAVSGAIAAAKEAGLAAAEQSNMIGDPSFELNTAEFWTLGTGVTNVTTLPRTGTRHLRLTATTTAREGFRYNRVMPCQPGDTFYFRMYIDPQTTVPDDGLRIEVMSGATSALGTITEAEGSGALTAAGYIMVTGSWTVPAGINFFKPRVWIADVNNTSIYFVDDFRVLKMTGPVDLVAGSVTADKIAANSIVAEHLQANSVSAVKIQANAVTADKIAANSITGDKIVANSIDTNHVKAGAIQTNHLSPTVGNDINISGNVTIVAQGSRIDGVEGDIEGTQDNLAEMQLYYNFGPTGAVISKPGSIFATRIDNDSIDMLENGNVISYWNSGTMYVNQLVGEKVTLGNHQLEKFGTGTVVRSLG